MPSTHTFGETALLALIAVSVGTGLCLLLAFARFSNPEAIRKARRRMKAHLLSLRLFSDELPVVLAANAKLLAANARYMSLMLAPAAIIALPMLVLFAHLDAIFGRAPLKVGDAAIVKVQFRDAVTGEDELRLEAPGGIVVESPPVRIVHDRQVAWRIRVKSAVDGALRIGRDGQVLEKRITAGKDGLRYVAARRAGGWLEWLCGAGEWPAGSGPIEWVEIQYPRAEIGLFGVKTHWLVWLTAISMCTAIGFRKRFGVAL